LLAATGELQDDEGTTLIFNVEPASQPNDPHSDWQGFSGTSIVHREKPQSEGPLDLWRRPAGSIQFHEKIEVTRLAEALSDPRLLQGAGWTQTRQAHSSGSLPSASGRGFSRYCPAGRIGGNPPERRGSGTHAGDALPSFAELEKLHRGGVSSGQTFAPAELLAKFRSGGALLVKAPGGFGKSFYLLRTMLAAVDEGMIPFFLDLRGAELELDRSPDEDACAELFKKASRRAVKWDILRKARDKNLGIFVAVDGLNEALTPDAFERTLAYLLKEFGDRLVLMVSDRMSERPALFAAQLFTILPLNSIVVAARLPNLNLDLLGEASNICSPSHSF